MAIWDLGVTAENGADKKRERGRGTSRGDEADATLVNWFVSTQRIHHYFCKYIARCH